MSLAFKVLVFEDTFGTHHHASVRAQGFDPAGAYVIREVFVPDGGTVPESLTQAARFAADSKLGETGCIAWPNPPNRLPVVDTQRLICAGKLRDVKYLLAMAFPVHEAN
jgi:hypothetical protein